MNLHKRSCCSTWVPQKMHMEFAKDSRNSFFIREEWLFPEKGILINHHISKCKSIFLSLYIGLSLPIG